MNFRGIRPTGDELNAESHIACVTFAFQTTQRVKAVVFLLPERQIVLTTITTIP